jgi:23S rRNA (cytosine1962-C5)-methyltransferase
VADDPDSLIERPVVRLRPQARRRHRGPWAYADEVVLDRRTRAIPAGAVVMLEDADRQPIGTAAFNGGSKIAVRLLDGDPAAEIDEAWFALRIARALLLRRVLFDEPFYRLVHAEADGLPGVVIDRFGDAAVVQPNAAWADVRLEALVAALQDVTGVGTVVKNAGGRARGLEGLNDVSVVLVGALDGPVAVPMNRAIYFADLAGGQKTGIFYDQRPNHAFAARLAQGRSVLDVFAHVGGFGLAALAAGAQSVLAVDGSAAALALAERGAQAGGVAARFEARRLDAFEAMGALGDEGRQFGVVVCDPPAFAPNKGALEAGLRAYERVARMGAGLVEDDGFLVLCSCSHAADLARFRDASLRGVARAGRTAQILHVGGAGPDHPVHADLAETSYLKALFLRLGR